MAAKITCLKDLEEVKRLAREDIVEFTVGEESVKYDVQCYYLSHFSNDYLKNDMIFKMLELDKYKFAEKAYGYDINRKGYWPNSKNYDFEALTKLVKELYKIIEDRWPSVPEGVFEPIENRWDILDIRKNG